MHLNISFATSQPICSDLNATTYVHLDTKGMLDDEVQIPKKE